MSGRRRGWRVKNTDARCIHVVVRGGVCAHAMDGCVAPGGGCTHVVACLSHLTIAPPIPSETEHREQKIRISVGGELLRLCCFKPAR